MSNLTIFVKIIIVKLRFVIIFLIIIGLVILDIFTGSEYISISEAINHEGFERDILFNFRIPKLIAAILSGISLSSSGLVMQTVFRNPLAGPYMLGVSSGASLGVAVFMMATPFISAGLLQSFGTAASAWLGSAIVLIIVLFVSIRLRDIMSVLILGMMIGSAASAFVDVLQFFSTESALKGFVLWSMGSLGALSYIQLIILFLCTVIGIFVVFAETKNMDVILLGENYATSMGVNVKRTRIELFISTALLAGGVTAFCGPIAFIGIAAPHIARMIWKRSAHRFLLPSSILVGIVMMVLCDILSSLNLTGYPLPLNTVTALLGIPVVFMVVWNGNRAEKIM